MFRSLSYKAWRETRARFLLGAAVLAGLCAAFVAFHTDAAGGTADRPLAYAESVWRSVYKGPLRQLFVGLVVMLGVGGLRHEGVVGTAGFTLSLPVSRARLAAARALVGLAEVAALAAVPAVVLPALSPAIGARYPIGEALGFGVLWAVGGAWYFGLGVLASALAAGAATTFAVAFCLVFLYAAATESPWLARHATNVYDLMSGSGLPYVRADTGRFVGPLPWPALAAVLLGVLGLVWAADRLTRRLDL